MTWQSIRTIFSFNIKPSQFRSKSNISGLWTFNMNILVHVVISVWNLIIKRANLIKCVHVCSQCVDYVCVMPTETQYPWNERGRKCDQASSRDGAVIVRRKEISAGSWKRRCCFYKKVYSLMSTFNKYCQ